MTIPMSEKKTASAFCRRLYLLFFCSVLLLALSVSGCGNGQGEGLNTRFTSFTRNCFKEYAAADSIRLHFTLRDPSRYGLSEEEISFPDLSAGARREDCDRAQALLKELRSFDRKALSKENRLTYDIFERKLMETIAGRDFILYPTCLGSAGVPSQIPVTLSEYYFDDLKDVENYLALLKALPAFFEQMIRYEKERNEAGFYCPAFTIDRTIEQIDHFLADTGEEHFLITSFEERIRSLKGCDEAELSACSEANRALLETTVFPAYRSLRKTLVSFERPADCPERLCQYEKGRAFCRLLLQSNVGTDRSPEECIDLLEKMAKDILKETETLNESHEDLYADYLGMMPVLSDPEEILSSLKTAALADFPDIKEVPCSLQPLPDPLSGTYAAAFFLIPPVDSPERNVIYINQNHLADGTLLPTLAHEGYPGHLYQNEYYLQKKPDPLRHLLKTPGFDEGWGTYAQLLSYDYMEFRDVDEETEKALQSLCRSNDLLSLTLSALSDLYVNYMDYDRQALTEWLSDYDIDKETAWEIYEQVTESPLTWSEYVIGYYELSSLLSDYHKKQGQEPSPEQFHKKVLDCGSCPFDLLREQVLSAVLK